MQEPRKTPIKSDVEQLLFATRRRCCLCYFLNDDKRVKRLQIAHINQKRNDSDVSNLVPLCLDHHDEYDSTTRLSKKISEYELRKYKELLLSEISQSEFYLDSGVKIVSQRVPYLGSSIYYNYGNLFFSICIELFNFDALGIANYGNFDEYAPEVHDIIARLQNNPDGLSTSLICQIVFVKWFDNCLLEGVDFSEVAIKIEQHWKRFKESNNVYG